MTTQARGRPKVSKRRSAAKPWLHVAVAVKIDVSAIVRWAVVLIWVLTR